MFPFIQVEVENWTRIQELLPYGLARYIFRGQADARWPLTTSLERCLSRYEPWLNSILENREHWMLHEFKRKSHLYSQYTPDEADNAEWLAMMQHHGCPTRLLDFSYSFYVAAYFAVVEAESDSTVWGIDWWTLRDNLHARFKLEYQREKTLKDEVNRYHLALANGFIANQQLEKMPAAVIPLEPRRLTERVARQQGLFAMPTDAKRAFMDNLFEAYNITVAKDRQLQNVALTDLRVDDLRGNHDNDSSPRILKLIIPESQHKKVIGDLGRMNITAETLFPGLDSLARSLVQTVVRRL